MEKTLLYIFRFYLPWRDLISVFLSLPNVTFKNQRLVIYGMMLTPFMLVVRWFKMRLFTILQKLLWAAPLLLILSLSACYMTPPNPQKPRDPFQHLNRDTSRFNHKMDKAVIKPIAKGYKTITPYVFRRSVANFFSNLGEVLTIGNDLLQGDIGWTLSDFWRFVINSTVGIAGIFDPASHLGLVNHKNDFGLTLNRWHFYSAYLVLPFLGPSTVNRTIALPVDYYMGLASNIFPPREWTIAMLLKLLNKRAQLLGSEKTAKGLIFDPYIFYQNAYFQYRAHLLQINKNGPYFNSNQRMDETNG